MAAVIKFADNIWKGFATAGAIVVTGMLAPELGLGPVDARRATAHPQRSPEAPLSVAKVKTYYGHLLWHYDLFQDQLRDPSTTFEHFPTTCQALPTITIFRGKVETCSSLLEKCF